MLDLCHFLLPLETYKRVSKYVEQVLDLHIKYFKVPSKEDHYQNQAVDLTRTYHLLKLRQ